MIRVYGRTGECAGFHAEADESTRAHVGLAHAGEYRATTRPVVPLHMQRDPVLYLQVQGESRWRSDRGPVVLGPGHLWVVSPGRQPELDDATGSTHHYLYAALNAEPVLRRLPCLADPWHKIASLRNPLQAGGIELAFRQLLREVEFSHAYPAEGLSLALDYLVIRVCRLLAGESPLATPRGHWGVTEARRLLEEHPEHHWTLAELAASVGMSSAYLGQVFTTEVGTSPHGYLIDMRMQRAKELLPDRDLSITSIAVDLGFSSSQHFSRVFHRRLGCSPGEFRRRWSGSEQPPPKASSSSSRHLA